MTVGVLSIHVRLPGCTSLKEKRGRIKPVLARLHREFNVSAVEMDLQDHWQEALLACAALSNDRVQIQRLLQKALDDIHDHFVDIEVLDHHIELM
jgi:uncharacterized protein YlxP (DUF503 family)